MPEINQPNPARKQSFLDGVKKLREETEISIVECKKALEAVGGDLEKAKEILKRWGKEVAQKKAQRKTSQGIVKSYVHSNKKIGALLELGCESDFVANSPDFQNLAHELCLQITARGDEEIPLLEQPWIKDDKKKIDELINEHIVKFGENITIKRFARYEI